MGVMEVNDILSRIDNADVEIAVKRTAELMYTGLEAARKNPRQNDNWDIVWVLYLGNGVEIVIGDRHTDFQPYVAWHCFNGNNYSWGHYCQTFGEAFLQAVEKIGHELHID